MHIIFDHTIFSQQAYGGVSRYFYELSKEFTGFHDVSAEIVAPIYINEYINNVDNIIIGIKAANYLPKQRKLSSLISNALAPIITKVRQPNIIHETYYSDKSLLTFGCKRVLTVYDMIHELYPESFPESDRTTELKRSAVGRADHIICISENTRRDLISLFGVSKEKTSVIHLGFKLKSEIGLLPLNPDLDFPYLLYVGNREGYKNFLSLLKAFSVSKCVNDAKLICFGGGPFTVSEHTAIKDCGLNSNKVVHMSGDDSVLASLYANAKLFVYPSLYEGFGIPPLEAMSYGCPVVCSNSSSIPEVVGEAAEFFNGLSVHSIKNALEQVFYSKDYASILIQRGKERIKCFSWENCARDTLSLYRKLV